MWPRAWTPDCQAVRLRHEALPEFALADVDSSAAFSDLPAARAAGSSRR